MKRFFLLLALVSSSACYAQAWPSKPVRVIVNVAAGGVADVTARVLGARMTETLGQTFLVENRAGGDGYIGFDAVARSDADGHTLLYSPGSSMMIAPHIVMCGALIMLEPGEYSSAWPSASERATASKPM